MDTLPSALIDMIRCFCKKKEIIVGRHAAYYPCMGMFKVGRGLLVIPTRGFCWHFWHGMVMVPEGFCSRLLFFDKEEKVYVLSLQVHSVLLAGTLSLSLSLW